MRILWLMPIIGALAALLVIAMTLATSKGAPQEAAGFALACAVAIIPYVFTRALVSLFNTGLQDSTEQIVAAIRQAAADADRPHQPVTVTAPSARVSLTDAARQGPISPL